MTDKGLFSSFRVRVLILFIVSLLSNMVITGGIILSLRLLSVRTQSQEITQANSESFVIYAEELLDTVAKQVSLMAVIANFIDVDKIDDLSEKALQENSLVQSFFILNREGDLLSLAQSYVSEERSRELIGNNFSNLSLFQTALNEKGIVWSDSYVSPLARNITIGAAFLSEERVVIAEVSLPPFIERLKEMGSQYLVETSIIDKNGNLIADTGDMDTWMGVGFSLLTLVDEFHSTPVPQGVVVFRDKKPYYINIADSSTLHWKFLSRTPASIGNPIFKAVIIDILLLTGISLVVVATIVITLLRRITTAVDTLIDRARAVTVNKTDLDWSPLGINEFNEFNQVLKTMTEAVRSRELKLKTLNEELEHRVQDRTAELTTRNKELANTIKELQETRDELTRSENLASLGRMVAGIAHELNTPIGNGIMALSTMADQQAFFENKANNALTKSDLFGFLEDTKDGIIIAQRNLEKAADLVNSFKQVANDQSSNLRRTFYLDQMLGDLLLTLQPTFKRSPHKIETDIQEDILMDSFPGVLGQIVINLINNALLHAWREGEQGGVIELKTKKQGDIVHIIVSDNGHGIPQAIHSKVFDPFFTTKQNAGGTGLGLKIAQNGAENVLGGSLYFSSSESEGTHFFLEIPCNAPKIESSQARE